MTIQPRHRWGEPVRFEHKTERECLNGCGTVRVTRHEGRDHWVEFWRVGDVEKLNCEHTPRCVPVASQPQPAGGRQSSEA